MSSSCQFKKKDLNVGKKCLNAQSNIGTSTNVISDVLFKIISQDKLHSIA